MNKNSNTYQILYAAVMVVIVGAALAFVYQAVRPQQVKNIENDSRKQILGALHVTGLAEDAVEEAFAKHITAQYLVDEQGNVTDSSENVAFKVNMAKNVKADKRLLPVYVAQSQEGELKYIIPMYGAGLWGPIWGYVAVDADGNTVYGTNFAHQGETPGLGAKIEDADFQAKFEKKHLYVDGAFKSVDVLKAGQVSTRGAEQIDAISGATITSRGVGDMMADCLAPYDAFLKQLQQNAGK